MDYINQEKESIIKELLNNGKLKPGQSIDYQYFKMLYEPYKEKMPEIEFASVLRISYSNYWHIKNNGQKAKALKDGIQKASEEEKQKIIEELLNSGKVKPGKSIDYQYFKMLYEPYKEKMEEERFAGLLGIKYSNYMAIKNQGTKAKVLKDRIQKVSEEEKQEIIEELLNSGKVKEGQLIDYKYFKELYEPYKEKMGERDFASLLGIKCSNYGNLKNKGTRAKILKDRIAKVNEEEKEEIIEELLNSGKVKEGQLIDYKYFKELYEPYKEKMEEERFAGLLGIKYNNYMAIKNQGTKAKVLKDRIQKASEENKQEIIEELLNSGKVKEGQLIEYKYFKQLYEPYKEKMRERDFATLLGISYSNYRRIKNKGQRANVLKDRITKVNEEEKEEIIEELLNSGKVKPGKSIDYQYFKMLYEPYKEKITEPEFASIIGISYSNYGCIKNKGQRAKVLKYRIAKVNEEEKEEIIEELLNSGKVKPGKSTDYQYFKMLYEPYKEKITEPEFASIIGISYSNYGHIKNKGQRAKITHYKDKEKIDRIKYILNQHSRYYSKEELDVLSKKYNCSIDTIIQYLLCSGMDGEYLDTYKQALEERR